MLINYGHVKINWRGEEFILSPTFANISKIGSPTEIIEDFKSFITTLNVMHKFNIAINVLNCCSDKELPVELFGKTKFSERQQKFLYVKQLHDLPMIEDAITLANHCFVHGICGKSDKQGDGDPIESFDAYEFMELARVHLGLNANEASNMTMTEFVRMMDAKFPAEKSDEISQEENDEMLAWLKEKNKVH